MQAHPTLAVLSIAAALCACKQDPPVKTDKEPLTEQAAAPATAMPAPKEKETYGLDAPQAATASTAKATSPAAAKPATENPVADAMQSKGPSAQGEGFEAHLAASNAYKAGAKGTVTVVLNAKAPFHCNDKYPYKFTVKPTAGVQFAQDVVKGMKIGEQQSTMAVEFTPSAAGKHTLEGTLAFSVCTDDKCLVEKQALSVTIDVEDAS